MSRVNRYRAPCVTCGGIVPALGGRLDPSSAGWLVRHTSCADTGSPQVVAWTDHAGRVLSQRNVRGTCEDAPCCGCCF